MAASGVDRALEAMDASHFERHPARGWSRLHQLVTETAAIQKRYPNDPALAAEMLLPHLRRWRTYIDQMEAWAEDTAHQSFSPTPHTGAQV